MAGALDVIVKFLADSSSVKDEVDKVEGTGAKIKDWAGKAALAIGGAFAVDKIVDFGKESVNAAAEDAAAQAMLAQTLRDVTGASDAQIKSTESWITKASKQYAVADDDLRPALANLVRGFGSTEKATQAMTTALDVSAGTGKDLGSVTEAMMKAAQGNIGALGRMGIATKDASGKAKSMDQIMSDLSQTFKGQAAAAADTTAGKMKSATIQFHEFQEQIGTALLPVMSKLADVFQNVLLPAISAVVGWIEAHGNVVVAALVGVGVVLMTTVVPAFIAWAASAAAAAAATLIAMGPVILIGAAVAAVAYLIISNWDTVKAVTEAVWHAILAAVHWVWDFLKDNWPLIVGFLLGPIALAAGLIYKYWDQIKGGAADVWNFIRGGWDSLVGFFTSIPGRIAGAAAGMWHGITDAFRGAINALIDIWNRLHFTLPSIDWGPIHLGGNEIGVPTMPHLATGGLVAQTGMAVVHAGERVVPPGGSAAAIHIENAHFTDGADIDLLLAKVQFAVTAGRL